MQTRYKLALAGALVLGLAGPALAAGDEDDEANALQRVPTTLLQAITTAEQLTGGKAFDAGVNVKAGAPRIVVETAGPKGVTTVTVDARSGQVLGTHGGGEPD